MKKLSIAAAMAVAAIGFTACGNSTPKEELKTDVDSLSYAFGIDQGQSVKQYLQQMDIDTAYVDEFLKGMNAGATSLDDKKKKAYNAGVGAGMQMAMVIKQQLNKNIFGADSTQTISIDNFLAGFAASAKNQGQKMTLDQARKVEQTVAQAIQAKSAEKTYAKNKAENDKFMANVAKRADVKALKNGVFYKELKAGSGAKPTKNDIVKVNYEGKNIAGKVFDQRDGATMPLAGVVPGFTEALSNMPVGSKWEIYIPYKQGYGAQETSPELPPFSTLVFTVELLSIEKAPQAQGGKVVPQVQ